MISAVQGSSVWSSTGDPIVVPVSTCTFSPWGQPMRGGGGHIRSALKTSQPYLVNKQHKWHLHSILLLNTWQKRTNDVCNYRLNIWSSSWSVRVSETVFLQTETQFFLRYAQIQRTSAARGGVSTAGTSESWTPACASTAGNRRLQDRNLYGGLIGSL